MLERKDPNFFIIRDVGQSVSIFNVKINNGDKFVEVKKYQDCPTEVIFNTPHYKEEIESLIKQLQAIINV